MPLILAVAFVMAGLLWGFPHYQVHVKRMSGQAELEQQEFAKRVMIEDARARADVCKAADPGRNRAGEGRRESESHHRRVPARQRSLPEILVGTRASGRLERDYLRADRGQPSDPRSLAAAGPPLSQTARAVGTSSEASKLGSAVSSVKLSTRAVAASSRSDRSPAGKANARASKAMSFVT